MRVGYSVDVVSWYHACRLLAVVVVVVVVAVVRGEGDMTEKMVIVEVLKFVLKKNPTTLSWPAPYPGVCAFGFSPIHLQLFSTRKSPSRP